MRYLCERLERRIFLANFIVTNTLDSGPGSLRDALSGSNGTPEHDFITFNIPGPGPHAIRPLTMLPEVTNSRGGVTINGYTQPGALANTLAVGNNAVIKIEIDGSAMTETGSGLVVNENCVIQGLSITGFMGNHPWGYGIRVDDRAEDVIIEGNLIGVTPDGTARGNQIGVFVDESADRIQIGGPDATSRNTISGQIGIGILFLGNNSIVQNNYVGTSIDGGSALPNGGSGVLISGSARNVTVGGAGTARNVIAGNGGDGIAFGESYGVHVVAGNFIGLGAGGEVLGNARAGISISDGGLRRIEIGHFSDPQRGNFISGNAGGGVNGADDNTQILLNSISNNGQPPPERGGPVRQLGIDLLGGTEDAFGVTANDPLDADVGLQNFPALQSATTTTTQTSVAGTLHSKPATQYRIDFYGNRTVDPSGHGEGERWLGSTNVTTDGSGDASFSAVLIASAMPFISSTATALSGSDGTSEFSLNVTNALPPQIVVTNGNPSGAGSLSQALLTAAGTPGPEAIIFDIPGTVGVLIAPSAHPGNMRDVLLDAETAGMFGNAPRVFVNGPANRFPAVLNNTIKGLGIVNMSAQAVHFFFPFPPGPTGNNTLANCFIGVGPAEQPLGSTSAAFHGSVTIDTDNNGNRIINNVIHRGFNRAIVDLLSDNNIVQGNLMGITPSGNLLPNNSLGIQMQTFASDNQITGNTFANYFGSAIVMFSGTGNRIQGNQFISVDAPLDLHGDGPTPNDPDDTDTGANNLQNFPELASAEAVLGGTRLIGSLDSAPSTDYRLDFYREDLVGSRFTYTPIGFQTLATDANGLLNFDITPSWTTQFGQRIVATATDPAGNTSEISGFVSVSDTTAPTVLGGEYDFEAGRTVVVQFSENVGASLQPGDLLVQSDPETDYAPIGVFFDAATNRAFFTFAAVFPDGDYTATLAAGSVADPAGNPLAAAASFDFFVLAGDANRDRRVNLQDFNILAINFGQSNRAFSQGDFNYDGTVNLQDFNILASRFGRVLGRNGTPSGRGDRTPAPSDAEDEELPGVL